MKLSAKQFLLAVLSLSLSILTARPVALRYFTTARDISSTLINQLYQTSNSMMWVATEDGLNRYDGNKFAIYRHIPGDSTSLFSSYVKAVFEDDEGRLYACTRRGVQIFDPATESFFPRLCEEDSRVYGSIVNTIIRRGENDYWVAGNNLRRFSTSGPDAFVLKEVPGEAASIGFIRCGITDRNGNLWLGQTDGGVYRIAPDDTVTCFMSDDDSPRASSMAIGQDGQLYIGTVSSGLLRFNEDTDTFSPVARCTDKEIKQITAKSDGDLIISTDGDGAMLYSPATGVAMPMEFGFVELDSNSRKVHSTLIDDSGNMWVALFQSGLCLLKHNSNGFEYMGSMSTKNNLIGRNCISSILVDSDNVLWVGADHDGIYKITGNGPVRHFVDDAIIAPMSMLQDSKGRLWVGTYLNGVGRLNPETGKFNRVDVTDRLPLAGNICFAMAEDRDHRLWLGMLNSGLLCYDLQADRPANNFSWREKIDPWIASLYYSPTTNSLYVGSYTGLQVINNLSNVSPTVTSLLPDDVVHCIDETRDGMIWLATTDGLVRYNPNTCEVRRYNSRSGLHNNTVYALHHVGNELWLSLNSGLARFDPATEQFTNFLVDDGLHGNEFYRNSVGYDRDGTIFFGGIGGITYFNPHEITSPGRHWTPRIVGIYRHGQPYYGDAPAYELSSFSLEPDVDSFSIEFGTRELGRPESVRFAYSLDNKDWELLPTGTYVVNFHRLDAGRHTLKFKTVDGATESQSELITFRVKAPWYLTIWAKTVYFLIVLALAIQMLRSHRTRLRHKAELLELTHAEELNEARVQSFINISHDIRTPMTLVISPLKKLMSRDSDPSRQREYGLILRNANRILRLVNELMDLRKIEKNQMKLELVPAEISPIVKDVCETFAHAAETKQIDLRFNSPVKPVVACIDYANFDKILVNLVSNALKYTMPGGYVHIDLALADDEKSFSLMVTDSGRGIPDEAKAHVFERFYQAPGNTARGTGVGLHLTRQLVLLHGGDLVVTDNPDGQGTRFTLTLPLGGGGISSAAISSHGALQAPYGSIDLVDHSDAEQTVLDYEALTATGRDRLPQQRPASSNRILVVEDDDEIRRYLVAELSPFYRVDSCGNGKEAIDYIFGNDVDLVLTDLMMPMMDGVQLTSTIKNNINLNHIPVIVISALTKDEDTIRAIEAGADDFVTKPFNIEVLSSKIAGLLVRYRMLRNRFSGGQQHDEKIEKIEVASADEKLMERVMAVINREISNTEFTVEQLAEEVGLSRVHLHRRLKALTNQSPRDFIRNTRLREAARLLREKRLNVSEVADLTGFSNASIFAIAFKRLYGVTPTSYVDERSNTPGSSDADTSVKSPGEA